MLIKEITKNSKEIIRISVDDYLGHTLVSIRAHYCHEGAWLPTRKGISIPLHALNETIQGMIQAHNVLEEHGQGETP